MFALTHWPPASSGPAAPSMFDDDDDGGGLADVLEEEEGGGSDDDAFVVAKPQVRVCEPQTANPANRKPQTANRKSSKSCPGYGQGLRKIGRLACVACDV